VPKTCLYCGEKITINDPRSSVYVKVVNDAGKVERVDAWHPRCKPAFVCHDPEGQWIADQKERWGALPLGEKP